MPGEADPMKQQIKPTFKKAEAKVQDLTEVVNEYEADLDIRGRQWAPGMAEYDKVIKYAQRRKYHLALDHLERLLIQRLFELQKGHLEGTGEFPSSDARDPPCSSRLIHSLLSTFTGYKLRTHIAKHLKKRSETIRTALKAFNSAAAAVGAEKLDFKTVINYAFVSQFNLLRNARQDIRSKPWSKASNRYLMDKLFERDHAREEIARLNVEVARLRTWIRDEDHDFRAAVSSVRDTDGDLAAEIEQQARRRFRIHEHILKTLHSLERTTGFTGTRIPGQSVEWGALEADSDRPSSHPGEGSISQLNSQQLSDDESDVDEGEDRLDRVVNALNNMI